LAIWPRPATEPRQSFLSGYTLVLVLKVLDCFAGVHVENGLANRKPLAAVEKKDGRGVAQGVHGGQPFHVAAFPRFRLDGHGEEGRELAGVALPGELHRGLPLTVLPPQTTGLAGGGGSPEEVYLQPLALERE